MIAQKTFISVKANMNVINGQIKGPLSLQDERVIMKFKSFGHETVEDYQNSLAKKNLADLFTLAMRNSIIPMSDRSRLTRRLVDDFKKVKSQYEFILNHKSTAP